VRTTAEGWIALPYTPSSDKLAETQNEMPRGLVGRPQTDLKLRQNARLPIARMLSHSTPGNLRVSPSGSQRSSLIGRFSPASPRSQRQRSPDESLSRNGTPDEFVKATSHIRGTGSSWQRWLASQRRARLRVNMLTVFARLPHPRPLLYPQTQIR